MAAQGAGSEEASVMSGISQELRAMVGNHKDDDEAGELDIVSDWILAYAPSALSQDHLRPYTALR